MKKEFSFMYVIHNICNIIILKKYDFMCLPEEIQAKMLMENTHFRI